MLRVTTPIALFRAAQGKKCRADNGCHRASLTALSRFQPPTPEADPHRIPNRLAPTDGSLYAGFAAGHHSIKVVPLLTSKSL